MPTIVHYKQQYFQGGQDSQTDGGDESPGPAENGHDTEGEGDSEEDEDDGEAVLLLIFENHFNLWSWGTNQCFSSFHWTHDPAL